MTCLSTARVAELQARKVTLTAQLTAVDAAIAAHPGYIKSLALDTGVGKQTTVYSDLDKMEDRSRRLQSQIDTINKKLRGTGLVNFNLDRKRTS